MMYVKDAQDNPTLKAWTNIKAIVESSWWSRAWVYQEFMLATTAILLVNEIAVPWLELRDLLSKYFDGLADYNQTLDSIRADHERQIQKTEAAMARMTDRQVELVQRVANLNKDYRVRCYGWHHGARHNIRTCWVSFGYPPIDNVIFGSKRRVTDCDCGQFSICFSIPYFFLVVLVLSLVFVLALIVNILSCASQPLVFCMTLPWRKDDKSLQDEHTDLENSVVVSHSQVDQIKKNLDEYIEKHRKSINDANKSWDVARFILASKSETANGSPITLSKLLKHARNCNCIDSRDKTFAFLGLADPIYGIVADYRSTNTLKDVLIEATMAMIKTENSLSVLNDAMEIDAHPQVTDHLPSWIPNFTRPDRFNSEYYHFIAGIRLPVDCHASGHSKPIVEFCEDRNGNRNRILKCRGKRICHLTRMIPDNNYEKPWTRFETEDGMAIETARAARVGDEIWILFGADVPFCLSKPSPKDPYYQLIGQAMLWERDQRSEILNGNLIDGQDGSYEEICIV